MLILASVSPRRRELMKIITSDFIAVKPLCDEDISPDTEPEGAVRCLALRKAASVLPEYASGTVIGADTIVVLGGRILGKPENRQEAIKMLFLLSGKSHTVYTGVAIANNKNQEAFSCATIVHFRELSAGEIEKYVDSGEPMDKAGAYGIQGRGALFVSGIEGDFYNVMGLPVSMLSLKISAFNRRDAESIRSAHPL